MSKLILNPEYGLYERQGKPFCSSRQVAETFGKEHNHVLRDIKNAISTVNNFAPQFWTANFFESRYKDRGRFYPEYLLTKDGFTFLVMGFNGKKAAAFKIAYIKRFNLMESFINSLHAARLEHPAFTEAVMLAHEEPKNYHFSNETDMINRIVLGMSAKQFKEARGLRDVPSIRPYLATDEIHTIKTLQRADIGMLAILPEFERRKSALTDLYERTRTRRLALTA